MYVRKQCFCFLWYKKLKWPDDSNSFPGIINAETVVTASAGETAVLICPSSTDLAITFWTGPPGTTTYNYPGSTDILYPEGIRLEINETNAALLIHNVTLEDEGLYRCSATSTIRLVVTNGKSLG